MMYMTYLFTYNFFSDVFVIIIGGISFYFIISFLKLIFSKLKDLIQNQNELTQAINKALEIEVREITEEGGEVEFLSDMTEEEYEESIQPPWYKKLYKKNDNK